MFGQLIFKQSKHCRDVEEESVQLISTIDVEPAVSSQTHAGSLVACWMLTNTGTTDSNAGAMQLRTC